MMDGWLTQDEIEDEGNISNFCSSLQTNIEPRDRSLFRHCQLLVNKQHHQTLQLFVEHLDHSDAFAEPCELLLPGSFSHDPWSSKNEICVHYFQKDLNGHRFTIRREFFHPETGLGAGPLEVQCRVTQKFWLRLMRQHRRPLPEEEITTGLEELDNRYLVHSNWSDLAREVLNQSYSGLKASIPFIEKLEIYRGILRVALTDESVTAADLKGVVDSLMTLVQVYEKGSPVQVIAALAQDRCPFCRDPFGRENSPAIVKCIECSTLVHEACWQENTYCTTWGCNSEKAERMDAKTQGRKIGS